jgi:hypothetical protein
MDILGFRAANKAAVLRQYLWGTTMSGTVLKTEREREGGMEQLRQRAAGERLLGAVDEDFASMDGSNFAKHTTLNFAPAFHSLYIRKQS